MDQETLDKSKLKPEHRMVLDWLCRHPAIVYEFDEVADALNVKRGVVEKAFTALKHQRFGSPLPAHGPYGDILRPRHAWLPPDAEIRALYPKVDHPTLPPKPTKAERAPRPTAIRAGAAEDAAARRREILRARKESKVRHRLVVAAENAGRRQDRLDARAEAKALVAAQATKIITAVAPAPAPPPAAKAVKTAPAAKPAPAPAPAPTPPETASKWEK